MPPADGNRSLGATTQRSETLDALVSMIASRLFFSSEESVWDVANRICDQYFLTKAE
jgi:hypothetical protein